MQQDVDFDYKLFFDLTPDLMCIAGFDGYFKKINPAVSNLLEYSEEELMSRPINDFVYEEDKRITADVREDLTNSIPLFNFENRYVTKSGDIVWLAWTSLPVEDDELVFAVAKNITHKKRLEAERLKLLKKLTRVNDELKQVTLKTSHDLRSPLNSFLSVFELMDISKISDHDTLELIEILKLTGESLKETLNNYVDVLSEKLSEHTSLEKVPLDKTLNDVIRSINSLIKASGADFHLDFSVANEVLFNREYMQSVFLNLITNAIKYSKPELPPKINIYTEKVDGYIHLVVADNGQGFNMDDVKGKIFGMHQTFHDNPDSKGIGLYLVHKHITSLGGEIWVDSEVGEGTRFVISFEE